MVVSKIASDIQDEVIDSLSEEVKRMAEKMNVKIHNQYSNSKI
jgi:hypothetical protein